LIAPGDGTRGGCENSARDRLRGDEGDVGYLLVTGDPALGGGNGCHKTSMSCHGLDGEGGS
jgi:hypothetical protein